MIQEHYYKELFTTLIANMPKDTRNMVISSKLMGVIDTGTHWKIIITGPMTTESGKYDYAHDVNYNRKRSAKEIRNYKYVERFIKHVAGLYNLKVVDLIG